MVKNNSVYLLLFSFILSGCVTRTYKVTKERVDQDLVAGNRGYLTGRAPESKERRLTRETQVVEIELDFPIKIGRRKRNSQKVDSQPAAVCQEEEIADNKGYIVSEITAAVKEEDCGKYTVQKNDTLQKISQKLYGTTKKWIKIYDLNRDILSAPDKIYPGQIIKVPSAEKYDKVISDQSR